MNIRDPQEVDWALPVTRLAISWLPPTQRLVINHLAEQDFDFVSGDISYKSSDAQNDLGISPAAFRKNKQRAYQALRTLVPKAIDFLGVTPNAHVAEAIFAEPRGSYASNDDVENEE